jgi:Tfp pilus assembly protein PilX
MNRHDEITINPTSCSRECGAALITVLLLLVVVTVIGIAAVSVMNLTRQMVGGERQRNEAFTIAEGCVDNAKLLVVDTLRNSSLPSGSSFVLPGSQLLEEISRQDPNETNLCSSASPSLNCDGVGTGATGTLGPDGQYTHDQFTVQMDIDFSSVGSGAGGGHLFAMGYEGIGAGGAGAGGTRLRYKVDCLVAGPEEAQSSRITAVYGCQLMPDGCQMELIAQ